MPPPADRLTPRHPIRSVAQRTGLTTATLRVWERRYAVVRPGRSQGGQRLYSDADIERLQQLRHALQQGWGIGAAAALPADELAGVLGTPPPAAAGEAAAIRDGWTAQAMTATAALDAPALEGVLQRAVHVFGMGRFAEAVAAPFLDALGVAWERGELGIAHEHLASAVVRRVLAGLINTPPLPDADTPTLVAATLPGQMHEFGALLVGVCAVGAGWRVVYLGADLPAAEIARAAAEVGARAVAVSIVHPHDDPRLPAALAALRGGVGADVTCLTGGAGARLLEGLLVELGFEVLADLESVTARLQALRPAPAEGGGRPRRRDAQ